MVRPHLVVLLLLGLLSGILDQLALGQTADVSITLKLMDLVNTSSLRVELTVTNYSKNQFNFTSTDPFLDYRVLVVTANGSPVIVKDVCKVMGQETGGVQVERAILVSLLGGESYTEQFDVDQCFDLRSIRGVTITASRQFPSHKEVSVSNALAVDLQ